MGGMLETDSNSGIRKLLYRNKQIGKLKKKNTIHLMFQEIGFHLVDQIPLIAYTFFYLA
jgi:hypothetical protein